MDRRNAERQTDGDSRSHRSSKDNRISAHKAEPPKQDGADCPGRSSGGDTQHIGICQGILGQRLHQDAAQRQSRAYDKGHQHAGKTDIPDNIFCLALPGNPKDILPGDLIYKNFSNIACRDVHRTDGYRYGQYRGNQQQYQQQRHKEAAFARFYCSFHRFLLQEHK